MTKKIRSIFFILILFTTIACQHEKPKAISQEQSNVVKNKSNLYKEKLFPFFTTLENNHSLLKFISDHEWISEMKSSKIDHINRQLIREEIDSFPNVASVGNLFKWTDAEIELVKKHLSELPHYELKQMVHSLKESHQFNISPEMNNSDFFRTALDNELRAINRIIDVYALGVKSKYAHLDSVSYNVKSEYYQKVIHLSALNIMDKAEEIMQFYDLSLSFALLILEINERDEAIRFEPMELQENAKAVAQIPSIDWDSYPYSVLLIPGHGPEKEGVALSPLGILRCKLAADRYLKKMAPFLILSGGSVHPYKTPFCEAIEMKKTLMNQYQIPESAIIIEPHARHTTTNFRNAARLINKYGIPMKKTALCTTTADQSYYITNMNFEQRCREELAYVPHKIGKRLSRNDVEFIPLKESLIVDYIDPLDP